MPLCSPRPPSVILLAVLEGILLLMLIFLRQRIRIAIALLEEASRSGPVWEGAGVEGRGMGLGGGAGKVAGSAGAGGQHSVVVNTAE